MGELSIKNTRVVDPRVMLEEKGNTLNIFYMDMLSLQLSFVFYGGICTVEVIA